MRETGGTMPAGCYCVTVINGEGDYVEKEVKKEVSVSKSETAEASNIENKSELRVLRSDSLDKLSVYDEDAKGADSLVRYMETKGISFQTSPQGVKYFMAPTELSVFFKSTTLAKLKPGEFFVDIDSDMPVYHRFRGCNYEDFMKNYFRNPKPTFKDNLRKAIVKAIKNKENSL